MSATFLQDERLVDLLVKQTTEGLAPAEKAELERLMTSHRDADPELIERVAAAVALAGNIDDEPMPADLRRRVETEGRRIVAGTGLPVTDIRTRRRAEAPASSRPQWLWVAAAASIVIAVLGWWPRLREALAPEPTVPVVTTQAPAIRPEPTAQEKREVLLAKPAIVQSAWSSTADPASQGVAGDVIWDNETQTGYLRFTGLAANDPSTFQYQLWIFDANQDERYPIDGGVFDIPAGQSEVIIPIDAKIAVNAPVMFAVTMEKPGGVVVSGREHIVALAKVAAG
jgi:hypothetical protein